jgi:hypothetical protein
MSNRISMFVVGAIAIGGAIAPTGASASRPGIGAHSGGHGSVIPSKVRPPEGHSQPRPIWSERNRNGIGKIGGIGNVGGGFNPPVTGGVAGGVGPPVIGGFPGNIGFGPPITGGAAGGGRPSGHRWFSRQYRVRPSGHRWGCRWGRPAGHRRFSRQYRVRPSGHRWGCRWDRPAGHWRGHRWVRPAGHRRGRSSGRLWGQPSGRWLATMPCAAAGEDQRTRRSAVVLIVVPPPEKLCLRSCDARCASEMGPNRRFEHRRSTIRFAMHYRHHCCSETRRDGRSD